MSLAKYLNKRDFKNTPEPKSGTGTQKALTFVVQRHHASRLHYDFRLELDGALKSWAVPKGPSMNPDDKRLAMMVEDHPIDYQHFEGIIPKGNYGAGVVLIWDKGTYQSLAEKRAADVKTLRAGLQAGNLKFRLNGQILKGEFALVKLHSNDDNAWLLIKHRDQYAQNNFNSEDLVPHNIKALKNNKNGKLTKLPAVKKTKTSKKSPETIEADDSAPAAAFKPMMAKLETKIFDDENWIYERKFDGYRAIGHTNREAKLISRNGIDFSDTYPKIVNTLQLCSKNAVLDGELLVEDNKGKSCFHYIQQYDGDTDNLTLKYYVFDLLSLDGHDLRHMELIKRKQLLKVLIDFIDNSAIIYSHYVEGAGKALFEKAKKEGWEGVIAKDAQGYYYSGKRLDRWQKFKLQNSQQAIICGYTAPTGSRKHFGSLILSIKPGEKLQYIGNCGTGFSEALINQLYAKLQPLQTDKSPLSQKVNHTTKITWVKPKLVCEVWYAEWTADKHLRQPVFKGLRTDEKAENIVMETPNEQLPDEETITYGHTQLKVTHLNKVFWKDEGITKGQLINYYRDMAAWIVPYLKNKPISMRRQPNGIDDAGFFQKDNTAQLPGWVKTEPLYSESNNKNINYIIGKDAATLLYMVNLGCIEINPWLSSYKTPENPDYVVIDLDPHDVPFTQAVEAALVTREVFERMKLEVFIKTSGSKGLHIYCYLGGGYGYDFVKMFAEYTANLIHNQLPGTTSVERSPAKRKNKVYIDFLQNRRGQTIACPYSVRPRPGATVSTPLHWYEVTDKLNLADYTIFNIPERVKNINNPWQNLTKTKANLKKALQLLKK